MTVNWDDLRGLQLPVNYNLGFPQRVYTVIHDILFELDYSFNTYENSLIFTMKRTYDNKICFHGKIVTWLPLDIVDPDYGKFMFRIVAFETTKESILLFLVYPGMWD